MTMISPLIFDLAIMLGIASIITIFFQRIGQPVVLGYLIAGIIIGPYTPPHILVNDIANIKILSELGVIFLIFSLGLEFSFHKLMRVGFSATFIGLLEVLFMIVVGFALGKLMGWSFNNALFLGAALSISSTTIIIKAIEELDMLKKHFAELIFGVLIIEDLLAILLLVLLSAFVMSHDVFSTNMLWILAKLILVIGGWFIAGYFLVPIIYKSIASYVNDESMTIAAISLCLLLVAVASYLEYSIALGAFVMGSILAETNAAHQLKVLIKPIRDIFAAVFFIATGMLMDPRVVVEQWPIVLLISTITILGKILSAGLSAFLSGQSLNTSLHVGFGMAQIGEFSFIIIGLGIALNAIDETLFPIIVTVSIITTFTTPYLMRFSSWLIGFLEKNLSDANKLALKSYSVMMFKGLSVISLSHFKSLTIRLIINGIVIAIIFTLSYQVLLPILHKLTQEEWLTKTICWLIALVMSSPFLWGMIFYSQDLRKLFPKRNLNLPFLIAITLSIVEIILFSLLFFQTGLVIFSLLVILTIIFIIMYSRLEKTYIWFEKQLKQNINNRKRHR